MAKYQARCPLRLDLVGFATTLPTFTKTEGHDLVAASIRPYVEGRVAVGRDGRSLFAWDGRANGLSYRLRLPPHAGLGASAAQTLVWVTLARTPHRDDLDRLSLAHLAQDIDTRLDNAAPWADYVACAHGGLIRSRSLLPHEETVDTADSVAAQFLSEVAILVYVSPARPRSASIGGLEKRLLHADRHVWDTLRTMKSLSGDVWSALHQTDVRVLADIFRDHWRLQTQLTPDVSTPEVESVLRIALTEGALAGRLCGFGGGGSLLLLAPPDKRHAVAESLQRRRLHLLQPSLDSYGLHFSKD